MIKKKTPIAILSASQLQKYDAWLNPGMNLFVGSDSKSVACSYIRN